MNSRYILLVAMLLFGRLRAQDTFSILAFDTITHEIGAAGASCVDLFQAPGLSNHFICEVFPDTGAIASQASYLPANQDNARMRMRQGDTPSQLISWLIANDVQSDPTVRQYGVIRFVNGKPQRAAHTGTNCFYYKNHITGPNYTIHGNILMGQQVLDSMEAGFLREKGDLACKLMAAMQGAKMVGADARCTSNNSSSLFAFLKVTRPTDMFGNPSFIVSLKTHDGAQIEPIDSLQAMFSAVHSCTVPDYTGIALNQQDKGPFSIYPNPAKDQFLMVAADKSNETEAELCDVHGRVIVQGRFYGELRLNTSQLRKGVYIIRLRQGQNQRVRKLVIE